MYTFDPLSPNTRRDFPPPGYAYLDVAKVRELTLPRINRKTSHGSLFYRGIGDFCNMVTDTYGIKMYMILHRPTTYWSEQTVERLAKFLEVEPESLKVSPPSLHHKIEWCNKRPQDFLHDLFQTLAGDESKGKRLNTKEFNAWLGQIVNCSARTIYNLRNGTANPSQMLVQSIANHYHRPLADFYRA